MASLLPEFQYDIFISYRQKDNKADQWTSAFCCPYSMYPYFYNLSAQAGWHNYSVNG
ncbi:MAG: hypothetical protein ABFS32_21880 [Bacteroidota bacterium]